MSTFTAIFLFFSLLLNPLVRAEEKSAPPAPKREVRAVWLTTVLGLDWPKSNDPSEQRRALQEIVARLREANFNTIFFQVRSRGDAMYRSQYEPWAQQLTGTFGKDPGWDPLAFIIREAHEQGIELHAWFNTMLVKNSGKAPVTEPLHVTLQHPEWCRQVDGEWWIDPGIPAARTYLIDVAMDLVKHYDIDGIHFDFIRYPAKPFPDEASYKRYGKGVPKETWRRDNISKFVESFHDSVMAVKPMVKIGAAPIGIYTNIPGARGLQGYTDLYQDSRRWLREGWIDYLAPQVYWTLGQSRDNPDFARLAHDWEENASGKQVYLGVAAYKPEVKEKLPAMIDSTRAAGASGNSYFRYENISTVLAVGGRYKTPAIIPPMSWKDATPPNRPPHFAVQNGADGSTLLRWESPMPEADGDPVKMFVVYRSGGNPIDLDNPSNIVALLPSSAFMLRDTITHAASASYSYAVTALDGAYNESAPATERIVLPEIAELAKRFTRSLRLGKEYTEGSSTLYIPYELGDRTPIIIKILDKDNREVANVVDAIQPAGRYVGAANIGAIEGGTYTCLLVAGEQSVKRTLSIEK